MGSGVRLLTRPGKGENGTKEKKGREKNGFERVKNETIPETKPTEATQRVRRAFSRAADRYEGSGQMQEYAAVAWPNCFEGLWEGKSPAACWRSVPARVF